jgi:hypothetical protein
MVNTGEHLLDAWATLVGGGGTETEALAPYAQQTFPVVVSSLLSRARVELSLGGSLASDYEDPSVLQVCQVAINLSEFYPQLM